jgi:hypothetical protein
MPNARAASMAQGANSAMTSRLWRAFSTSIHQPIWRMRKPGSAKPMSPRKSAHVATRTWPRAARPAAVSCR